MKTASDVIVEGLPGPLIVALLMGLLALLSDQVQIYFVDNPLLPLILAAIALVGQIFEVYIYPKLKQPRAALRAEQPAGIRFLKLLV